VQIETETFPAATLLEFGHLGARLVSVQDRIDTDNRWPGGQVGNERVGSKTMHARHLASGGGSAGCVMAARLRLRPPQ
jgi:hypothetical protein